MKYWGFLVAKLLVAAAVLYAIWYGMHRWYPVPAYYILYKREMFLHDLPWTTLVFAYNLLVQGVLFVIVWDQRYRCRTCGRRLRMPVAKGSHSHGLLGPPHTDYICIYGHGTLVVPELTLTGTAPPGWKQNEDIWTELYSLSSEPEDEEA